MVKSWYISINPVVAAARRVFNATHQRCTIHRMRNALAHAPAKQRTAVAAMLKTIFAQENKNEKLGAFLGSVADLVQRRAVGSYILAIFMGGGR